VHAWIDTAIGLSAAGLAAGGYAYAANWPTSQIFGRTVIAGPDGHNGSHTAALTYDDGPSPRNTPALLDVLAQANVRATFFLIGEHVRKHPELARRVADAGHVLGNHTMMHPNMSRKGVAQIQEELARCQSMISDVTGILPVVFRPPYGARRPAVLRIARLLGLTPVMWNITAHDWEPLGPGILEKRIDVRIARNRKRGIASNILLHDASHLDNPATEGGYASRQDTVAVTRDLVQRQDLHFTTPLDWLKT
jgi:peptidoglycan-N-acetylglucosamine deacetylase